MSVRHFQRRFAALTILISAAVCAQAHEHHPGQEMPADEHAAHMSHAQHAAEKPPETVSLNFPDVALRDADNQSVKFVSEEIARAYAPSQRSISAYDTPIVTREEHHSITNRLRNENYDLEQRIRELERRLTHVNGLPESTEPKS